MERSRILVSFDICPFVQKARIVFDLKGLDVPTSYIDLSEKPRWFLDRVPTGKVPVLLDGDKAIFESKLILEYADEVTTGTLLPADPLARAEERAWMVYVDDLIMMQYRVLSSTEADEVERHLDALFRGLARLETIVRARAGHSPLGMRGGTALQSDRRGALSQGPVHPFLPGRRRNRAFVEADPCV